MDRLGRWQFPVPGSRWDEPVAMSESGSSSRPAKSVGEKKAADLAPQRKTPGTPTCSAAQAKTGAKTRSVMRMIGLDLGARHIAYCEVRDGKVVERLAVKEFRQLKSRLGPGTEPAKVGFEACREGWHVHDKLVEWGHEPLMLDTTRIRQIGVGQHKRKNDEIDAEVIATAVEEGRVPLAHVLSPARRQLRAELSVRSALVETRSCYITTIRGLARAGGVLLQRCEPEHFCRRLSEQQLAQEFQQRIAPLVEVLGTLQRQLDEVEQRILKLVEKEPAVVLCATIPGVSLIVAAVFISVIDNADRFKKSDSVGAYIGLVPSEDTTGGPSNRRLGSITKQGNSHARAMLVQAAWSIFRQDPDQNPLTAWAHHIANNRGKQGKRIAVVALARKLAGVMWAMCRDGTVFDGAMLAQQGAQAHRRTAEQQQGHAAALEKAAKKLRAAVRSPTTQTNTPSVQSTRRRRRKTQEVAA